MVVLGVDACKNGWVGVLLRDDGSTSAWMGSTLERLAAQIAGRLEGPQALAIDIPIGLPVDGYRAADVAAREVLGPRRSSVFFTPVREALLADTHAEATALSRELTGKGISQQAYALGPKILEAEAFVASTSVRIVEAHPEVSFTVLLGRPASSGKKTWAGFHERLRALATAGLNLEDFGAVGGEVAADDVLDAAVAAWTAQRVVAGVAKTFPSSPPIGRVTQRPVAIWA